MSRYDKCFIPAKVLMKFKCSARKEKGRPVKTPSSYPMNKYHSTDMQILWFDHFHCIYSICIHMKNSKKWHLIDLSFKFDLA